ncbi:trophoblast glycoprotein-like [Mizuhopecten yessoensis]|uniref:Trophoblast glycoprotein n=1 Tax=Mizuhopecten yessoensis TaxID=6573 RepID=A0A210QUV8_MIZYE|nr:trophoblast glycoprotein-like [Mizuhopecten yessoensis]OWF52507.1 Trophoblast glycoprotein [Mizuhopecten yessoensis]
MNSALRHICLILVICVSRGSTIKVACPEYVECECNETTIRCHSSEPRDTTKLNQNFFDELKDFIQPTTTHLTVSGGNITELMKNSFGSCSGDSSKSHPSLTDVVLRNNNIQKIHGQAFHCVPNVLRLDLSLNNWTVSNVNHAAIFSGIPSLEKLVLTDSMKDNYSGKRHLRRLSAVFNNSHLSALKDIYLGKNDLWTFTSDASSTLCRVTKNLRILDLHSNNLAKVVFDPCFGNLTNIQLINLRDNSFIGVTLNTVRMFDQLYKNNPIFTVDFRGNQWDCDCNLVDFVKWVKTTKVNIRGKQNMTCHDGQNMGKYLWDIPASELVCVARAPAQTANAGVVVVSILLVIICCVVVVVIILKRNSIKEAYTGFKKSYFAKDVQFSYASVNNSNVDV